MEQEDMMEFTGVRVSHQIHQGIILMKMMAMVNKMVQAVEMNGTDFLEGEVMMFNR